MDSSAKGGNNNSGVKTKLGMHVRQMAATEAFSPILLVVGEKSCGITRGEGFKKMGCETTMATMVGQTALDGRNVCMGTMEEGEVPIRRPLTTQLPPVIKAMPEMCLMAYSGSHMGPHSKM